MISSPTSRHVALIRGTGNSLFSAQYVTEETIIPAKKFTLKCEGKIEYEFLSRLCIIEVMRKTESV